MKTAKDLIFTQEDIDSNVETQKKLDANAASFWVKTYGSKYVSENGWYIAWERMAQDLANYIKEQKRPW